MSQPTKTPPHLLVACADDIETALSSVVDIDPGWLANGEKAALLTRLTTLSSQLEALRLRVLASAEDVAAEQAVKTTSEWVARVTRTDRRAAFAQQRLAEAVDARWTRVGAGVAEGAVHLDQARVIVKALDALPDDLDPEVRFKAEEQLLAYAGTFGPRELARLGRRVLDVVAPEVGEEHERRLLERAEQKAESVTRLDFRRRGDGATDLTATLPDAVAERLKAYLEAFTAPRHRGMEGTAPATGIRLPAGRQRGLAFVALSERLDPAKLPDNGGLATTLVVTTTLETLTTGLGTAGVLGTGIDLSPGEARRPACTAGIVPAVLGSKSEVLDLGRTARLFSPAQRKALAIKHPHCRAEGCHVPAPWCDAHHQNPWSQGGRTDLNDGLLLCHWHHRRAHDPRYTTERLPNGDLRYHCRT